MAIMLRVLLIRDFRLLWAGGLISSLGSWLLTLAIPTHIFLVTGSLRATGMTVAAVVPQTAMQRVIPNALLGRIGAVFLTGEAAAALGGAAGGPVLAQAAGLTATAAVASLVTLAAAALAWLSVPKTGVPQRHDPAALALSIGGQ